MAKWTSFQSIVDKAEAKGIYEKNSRSSLAWFRRNVQRMFGATPEEMENSEDLEPVQAPFAGKMYMYGYDPKYAEELPYYDTFPLIIMVGPAKGGFYGLNLHYLDPRRRALFFEELRSRLLLKSTNEEMSRFILSFKALDQGGKLGFFAPAWKHYLTKNVSTGIVNVPLKYWEPALFLPTERFQKRPKQHVWKESKKIISRR